MLAAILFFSQFHNESITINVSAVVLSFTIIGIIPLIIWTIMEGGDRPNEYGEVPTNTIQENTNIYDNY